MAGARKWDPMLVEWVDIQVSDDAHDSTTYIKAYKPCIRKTLGFYLGKRTVDGIDYIFIAECDERLARDANDCERINAIMECVIVKTTVLAE